MNEYCQEFIDVIGMKNKNVWQELHPSAQAFMKSLKLPHVHPICLGDFEHIVSASPTVVERYPGENDFFQKLVTLGWQVLPTLLAMGELWLRLFAFVIAPLSIAYLISNLLKNNNDDNNKISVVARDEKISVWVIFLGMASSTVILTDSLYVYEYGRSYGSWLFGTTLCLGILTLRFLKTKSSRYLSQLSMFLLLFIAMYLLSHSSGATNNGNDDNGDDNDHYYGSPGLDLPTIQEGFYYSKSNSIMSKVANIWPEDTRMYKNTATPYLPTGDAKTGIPFLVNPIPTQLQFHRVWVTVPQDQEAVALEIAFPSDGSHNHDKTVYLILHGLNGGTKEAYVRDFVQRRTQQGHTCIIMIARGLMDTPIVGWNVFKGSRVTDVEAAARAVRKALGRNQLLAGVGYSMGAIILSNYVARSGKKCQLDMAMAVSGGLDLREQLNFQRSKRLWQPMLAKDLREKFIIGKFDPLYRHRLTKDQYLHLMRSASVSEIDTHAVVTYNGYDDLNHYYSEMSAMGDSTQFKRNKDDSQQGEGVVGRISNVSIPFCVLHALDDPLVTWRAVGHDPELLVNTGSGFIMMVLTKSGGHVGWPLGLMPHKNSWKFMNDAVQHFSQSVAIAKTTMS